VFPADEDKTWSENLVTRLAAHRPGTYQGWKPEQLAAALKPHGVRTEQVWASPDGGGAPANRRGVVRAHLVEAHQRRRDGDDGGGLAGVREPRRPHPPDPHSGAGARELPPEDPTLVTTHGEHTGGGG
jgi:hypothetical protein